MLVLNSVYFNFFLTNKNNLKKKRMETYRIINRELSLNNQELRNALNKLKHEVTYLNRQLFEQREQFNTLKESIAHAIEKKYLETISLIYPDKVLNLKSPNRMNFDSHRRSCHNVTAADTLKRRMLSPTAKSPRTELMVDLNLKSPVPRVTIQRDIRISKSPQKNPDKSSEGPSTTDLQVSRKDVEEGNSNNDSKNDSVMSQSAISMNITLGTINEELSSGIDMRNETLTDTTINNLLDAPCSTPYNQNKIVSQLNTGKKEVRVLVQKLSVEKIALIRANTRGSNSSQLNSSEYNTMYCNSTVRLQKERTRSEKDQSDASGKSPQRKVKQKLSKSNKSAKRNQNAFKENQVSESENTFSDDESISKCLRRKRKPVCLKEPSLRQKLRNTTNLKI